MSTDVIVATPPYEQLRAIGVAAFAARLGVSVRTFHRWRHLPTIGVPDPLPLPGRLRWDCDVVDAFVRALREGPRTRHYFGSARPHRDRKAS